MSRRPDMRWRRYAVQFLGVMGVAWLLVGLSVIAGDWGEGVRPAPDQSAIDDARELASRNGQTVGTVITGLALLGIGAATLLSVAFGGFSEMSRARRVGLRVGGAAVVVGGIALLILAI